MNQLNEIAVKRSLCELNTVEAMLAAVNQQPNGSRREAALHAQGVCAALSGNAEGDEFISL